jgi:hypothetical protein
LAHGDRIEKSKRAIISGQCIVVAWPARPSPWFGGIKVMSYAPLDDSIKRQRGINIEIGTYEDDHNDHQSQQYIRSSPTATNGNGGRAAALSEPLSDPFYVLRDDLKRKIDSVDEALAEYLRVVFHTVRNVEKYSSWPFLYQQLI